MNRPTILRSTRADRLTGAGNVAPAPVCTVATWCEVAVVADDTVPARYQALSDRAAPYR